MKKLLWLLLLLPTSVLAQNQARMISGTNNITTCPYTIAKQDVTKLDVFTTSTACAVDLPAATTGGYGKGSIFSVKNNGTGSVTITIDGSENIDGNPTVTLLPGAGMDIYSTGTGYSSQPGAGGGGGGGGGINPPAGDIGGNAVVPLVISTHLNSPLPILQGGTGTQTPALVAGTGITITGSWPNQTINGITSCWQNNGSALTCEPFTNAVPPVTATLNSGNSTIDISVAPCAAGGSHTAGIVPDPGVSPDLTKFFRSDCTLAVPTAAVTAIPNPTAAANLSNTTAPWNINVDVANQGPNPSVDVRAYGVRAINPNTTPATTGLTANISSSSTTATISAASTFVNGDGVVIYGAGAAHAMSTPGAFTVTPSNAASSTGTGFVVSAPAGGITTCYKIAARDTAGGLTAASSEVCTTTGNALGSNHVTMTSQSQSNGTVTVVTSSPHTLAVGAMVQLQATSNPSRFDGWYTVATVADTTHFTFSTSQDTRTSGAASGTGGTVYWFNSNHLALPAPGAGIYEYIIYAGGSGAETLLGVTYPAVSNLSGDSTYMVYDDFGSTMMSGIILPSFIPNTPPGSATSDNLVTTIASGAGTTSLTLANAAGTTVTGKTIRFDNTPNIVAAFNAAKNTTGGMVYFPATGIAVGGLTYYTNSFLELTPYNNIGVSQSGSITLGDTMHLGTGTQWHGDLTPSQLTLPSFGIQANTPINIGAYPGIWSAGGNFSGLLLNTFGNGYLTFFLADGQIPSATFKNMSFTGGNSTDYMGVLFYDFAQFSAGGSAGIKFTDCLFSTGPTQAGNNGATATPLLISKNYGEISFDGLFMNRRGMFFDPNQAGLTTEINMKYEQQGGLTPMFTFTAGAGGFPNGWIHIYNTIIDTASQPLVANLKTGFGGKLTIDGTSLPGTNVPLISGLPFFGTTILNGANVTVSSSGTSQNMAIKQEGNMLDGVYNATPGAESLQQFNEQVAVGPGYQVFTGTTQPVAATCATNTAGPPFTAAGTYTFKYGAAFPPNGGVGPLSNASNSCTADGSTQQITITVPSPITGATGYTFWRNGQMISCSSPTSTSLSYIWTGSACGPSEAAIQGGGPAGIQSGQSWSISSQVGQYIDFAGLGSAPSNPSAGFCRTYYDSIAGTTKGINSSGGSCSPTGGGGGSGTVVPALQNSVTYYDQAGTVAHVAGVAGPTGPNSVPSFWVTIPSGSAATAPQPILAGIPGRTVSGASDTVLVTDRVSTVTYTNAGATAVSLPGAGTTGFGSNFCFKMKVQGSSAVATITPAAGTINGGATQTVLQGQQALVCSFDNSNYIATIADPPAAAGSNIALTRGDSSLSFASSAGGGTLTNAANSLPATQLICGNTYPDTLKCDLSGDASTSGSGVVTVSKVNGTSVSGTNGNVTKFGASNTLADSAIAAANLVTAASAYTSGDLVKAAASDKTTSDSGIVAANVVTSASNAAAANQLCASGGANKVCAFQSWTDLSATGYAGVATNSGDNYSACPSSNPATALSTNLTSSFKVSSANTTTTPTLNLCTLGAKTITKNGTSVLTANDIIASGYIATVKYDGTGWQLQNPATGGGGGSSALSSITAAVSSNTIPNGNNPQTWNWAQSTNSQTGITFGETSAATAGTVSNNLALQSNVAISTASASTATPLSIAQGSVTGSVAYPALQVASTWNNASLDRMLVLSLTDTAHGTGSIIFQIFGGASATTSEFSLDSAGNLVANGAGNFGGAVKATGTFEGIGATSNMTYQGGIDGNSTSIGTATFRGGDSSSTTAATSGGATTVRGGDESGSTANALSGGALTVRGGNANSSTSTSAAGGNVTITPGSCTGVASATTCAGVTKIQQVAFTAAATANDLACVIAANEIDTCSGVTGAGQFVGVIDSSTGNNVFFTSLGSGGRHTFNATSATFTNGHFVCQSTVASSGNLVVDSATICTAGFGVGIYVGATGSTTTPLVMMRPY